MNERVLVNLLLGAMLELACSTSSKLVAPPLEEASPAVLKMERTECFGFCPVFSVEIFETGNVVFHGVDNVREPGTHTGQLKGISVTELVDEFVCAGFFELKDQYTGFNDAPATILTLRSAGRTKRVLFQRDPKDLPKILPELEQRIAAAVQLDQWVVSGHRFPSSRRSAEEPGRAWKGAASRDPAPPPGVLIKASRHGGQENESAPDGHQLVLKLETVGRPYGQRMVWCAALRAANHPSAASRGADSPPHLGSALRPG